LKKRKKEIHFFLTALKSGSFLQFQLEISLQALGVKHNYLPIYVVKVFEIFYAHPYTNILQVLIVRYLIKEIKLNFGLYNRNEYVA